MRVLVIFLEIVWLIQDDLTEYGQLRPRLPFHCKCHCVWTKIYSFLLSILVSLRLQTCMMQKDVNHPSGLRNALGGHQFLIVYTSDLGWRLDNLSCQDSDSWQKVKRKSWNMMFSKFSWAIFLDSWILLSNKIKIDSMMDAFPDLRNYFVITFLFTYKNLILYFVLLVLFKFISTRSAISLLP